MNRWNNINKPKNMAFMIIIYNINLQIFSTLIIIMKKKKSVYQIIKK
jgi:hypothetical protein